MANVIKELGYDLTPKEVNRLINAVMRLGTMINDATERNNELRAAYDRIFVSGKTHGSELRDELYKLCQSGQWMSVLLGGCQSDIEYIKSHLNCIITLLQLEAAMKLDKKDGKQTTK